jgi:quercetin dioxygenase-like cupin family protein
MTQKDHFFNWDNPSQGVSRALSPGLAARIFVGEHIMLSVVTVAANAQGQVHSHAEEQWGVLLEGDGVRFQDGDEIAVKAGDFWRTLSGVSHGFRAGSKGALILDIFSPPREDYKKKGTGFAA